MVGGIIRQSLSNFCPGFLLNQVECMYSSQVIHKFNPNKAGLFQGSFSWGTGEGWKFLCNKEMSKNLKN